MNFQEVTIAVFQEAANMNICYSLLNHHHKVTNGKWINMAMSMPRHHMAVVIRRPCQTPNIKQRKNEFEQTLRTPSFISFENGLGFGKKVGSCWPSLNGLCSSMYRGSKQCPSMSVLRSVFCGGRRIFFLRAKALARTIWKRDHKNNTNARGSFEQKLSPSPNSLWC